MNDRIPGSEIDKLSDSEKKSLKQKKYKRLQEILKWLSFFKRTVSSNKQIEINFIDDINVISSKINDRYWEIIEKNVRPKLESKKKHVIIHHSKIISVLQLAIMEILPVDGETDKQTVELNALLSIFIGRQITFEWPKNKETIAFTELKDFEKEHMKWLSLRKIEHFPIFSNSFTWLLYGKLYNHLKGKRSLWRIFMKLS